MTSSVANQDARHRIGLVDSEVVTRLGALERKVAGTEIQQWLDNIDRRLDRVERRLELVDGVAAPS